MIVFVVLTMIFLSLAALQYGEYREAMKYAFGELIPPEVVFGDVLAFIGTMLTMLTMLTYILIGVAGDGITFSLLMVLFIIQSALHLYHRRILSRIVIWTQVIILLIYAVNM